MSDPVAGEPREREHDVPFARRFGAWVAWWVLMMAFWEMVDNSIMLSELLVGAAVAAMAAFLAEVAGHQAATRFRMHIEWTGPALRLPGEVVRDTGIVFVALWRRLVHGELPPSGLRELPLDFGDDTPEGVTRRALAVAGKSVAPNTFVLGVDADRNVMVVHQLVANQGNEVPEEPSQEREEDEK